MSLYEIRGRVAIAAVYQPRKSRGHYHFVVDSVLFQQWQLELIAELRVARLATVTPAGAPHLVVVCYAFTDGRFVIAVDEKPKRGARLARLRNIEHEPRVSLLFDRYDDDWTQLAWVRIDGHATACETGNASPEALAALRQRYPQYEDMALEALPLIVIEPRTITAWRWMQDSPLPGVGEGSGVREIG